MKSRVLVLAATYLAVMAATFSLLFYARAATLSRLGTPQAAYAWDEWRRQARDSGGSSETVARRVPRSPEPPALVLMRDRFGVVAAVVWLIITFLFAFLAFTTLGVVKGTSNPEKDTQDSGVTPDNSA